jgi:SAM-dependent methyltransferase
MSVSAEEVFYKKSNQYQICPYDSTAHGEPQGFESGGRYRICRDSLDANHALGRGLIVELGCGAGERLMYLKTRYFFADALGIDLAFREGFEIGGCRFLSANLNQDWDLPTGGVDCLVAMMLFEHLFDPWFCFSEVKRVLSQNGRAYVNLPLVTSIRNRFRLMAGLIPETSIPYSRWKEHAHWDGFHLHYFTLYSICDLAKASGLKVIKLSAVGRMSSLKSMFPSLLCNEISFELAHS